MHSGEPPLVALNVSSGEETKVLLHILKSETYFVNITLNISSFIYLKNISALTKLIVSLSHHPLDVII